MRSLKTLVNDNHMDLKGILAFIYYGFIVNNQPKKYLSGLIFYDF